MRTTRQGRLSACQPCIAWPCIGREGGLLSLVQTELQFSYHLCALLPVCEKRKLCFLKQICQTMPAGMHPCCAAAVLQPSDPYPCTLVVAPQAVLLCQSSAFDFFHSCRAALQSVLWLQPACNPCQSTKVHLAYPVARAGCPPCTSLLPSSIGQAIPPRLHICCSRQPFCNLSFERRRTTPPHSTQKPRPAWPLPNPIPNVGAIAPLLVHDHHTHKHTPLRTRVRLLPDGLPLSRRPATRSNVLALASPRTTSCCGRVLHSCPAAPCQLASAITPAAPLLHCSVPCLLLSPHFMHCSPLCGS